MTTAPYAARARKAIADADARGLQVLRATREKFGRLAAAATHTEQEKQSIRGLERRVNAVAARPTPVRRATPNRSPVRRATPNRSPVRRATPNRSPVRRATPNRRPGAWLASLPGDVFAAHVAPHLGAGDVARLRATSKNSKHVVGNVLGHARYDADKAVGPLVAALKQALRTFQTIPVHADRMAHLEARGWKNFGRRERAKGYTVPIGYVSRTVVGYDNKEFQVQLCEPRANSQIRIVAFGMFYVYYVKMHREGGSAWTADLTGSGASIPRALSFVDHGVRTALREVGIQVGRSEMLPA